MNQPNIHEQLHARALEQARFFFKGLRSGDNASKPHFFRLFSVKAIDTSSKGASSFYSNFEYAELEDSLACLGNALKTLGPVQMRFIVISLLTSKNANNYDHQIRIENPYFKGSLIHMQPGGQYPSVSGFGYGQSYTPYPQPIGPDAYQMQKQHSETMLEMRLQLEQMKHDREIERREDTIAALEHGNIGRMEKMLGLFMETLSSDAGKPVVQALVAKISGVPPVAPPPPPVAPPPPNNGQPQSDNPPPQQSATPTVVEVTEEQKRIARALGEIQQVFPDLPDAMADLAILIKHQPEVAKQLREQATMFKHGEA
ncbi:MAG: hypothetical protein ACRBFS_24425 [Aureispira sp.]